MRIYPKKISVSKYSKFPDRLKIAMDIRECSVQDLATSIYTTPNTISMYRCGKRMPRPEVLCLIAKRLDVTTDFLLGMTDFIYI
ncbi:MAG: helix-turn-helix transcriptional regulator [Agathobacter sp.]|nr:helix-turn-helix transcriptional regulator [Agathobacter sp.]